MFYFEVQSFCTSFPVKVNFLVVEQGDGHVAQALYTDNNNNSNNINSNNNNDNANKIIVIQLPLEKQSIYIVSSRQAKNLQCKYFACLVEYE